MPLLCCCELLITLAVSFPTFKGSVTPISEQELQAVTNDVSDIRRNPSVVFAVTDPPKLGSLVRRMPDNSTRNISTFTQSMVGDACVFATKGKVFVCFSNKRMPFVICHVFVSQVKDGVILYDQNRPQSVGWSAADAFSFTVSSPPAFLPPHTFAILISYQAHEHHDSPRHETRLLSNAGTVRMSVCRNLYFLFDIYSYHEEYKSKWTK